MMGVGFHEILRLDINISARPNQELIKHVCDCRSDSAHSLPAHKQRQVG